MTDTIILAAGNSKRFGKDNKLFTDFNSTLLITHVVSEICKSKLRNIIVITGKDHVKINKLLKKFRNKSKIIVPHNKTTRGNPVIFGKDYFNTLVNLVGDNGGKKILEENRDVIYYNTNSEGFYFDVDTKKDLTKLKNN